MYETFTFPVESNRTYLKDAIDYVIRRYRTEESSAAISIPPRSGKTDIQYAVSNELMYVDGAPFNLGIDPWIFLVQQGTSPDKVFSHVDMYGTHKYAGGNESFVTLSVSNFGSNEWWNPNGGENPPILCRTTTASAFINQSNIESNIRTACEAGVRPIIWFDEAHLYGDPKNWGRLYYAFIDAGAFVVSMTGTPYRADNNKVVGFPYIRNEDLDRNGVVKMPKRKDSERVTVKKWGYSSIGWDFDYSQIFHVSWAEAWALKSLALTSCNYVNCLSRITIDATELDPKQYADRTSDELRKYGLIRKALEDKDTTIKLADKTVEVLLKYKTRHPEAAWLVVVGDDRELKDVFTEPDKKTDRQCRAMKIALKDAANRQGAGNLDINIATLNSGPDKLDDFKNGEGDILIVKLMGLVGLDMKRLIGVTHASSIRKGPIYDQLLTRPLTPWEGEQGTFITISDKLNHDRWESIVVDNGGEAETESADGPPITASETIDVEYLGETIEDSKEKKVVAHFENHTVDQTRDCKGGKFKGDASVLANAIRTKYRRTEAGQSLSSLTDIELCNLHTINPFPLSEGYMEAPKKEPPPPVRKNDELKELRQRFVDLSQGYASSKFSYATNKKQWVQALVTARYQAKEYARIVDDLDKCSSITKVKKAVEWLERRQQHET